MKKDIKSILSVSLAAMDAPSSSKIDIPIDLTLDVRDDSGDSDSKGLMILFLLWMGSQLMFLVGMEILHKGSFSLSSRRPTPL